MNPHTYGHLIFDKGAKTIQWKTDSIFNKWCWHTGIYHVEECESIHSYLLVLRSNLSGSRNSETLKLIEEKVGKNLEDMHTGEKNS